MLASYEGFLHTRTVGFIFVFFVGLCVGVCKGSIMAAYEGFYTAF